MASRRNRRKKISKNMATHKTDSNKPIEASKFSLQISHAITLHRQGMLNEAEKIYHDILSMEPNQIDALHLTGLLNSQRGDYLRAIDFYNKTLSYDPKFSGAYHNRAIALNSLGKHTQSIDSFTKALTLDPRNADTHYNLGSVLSTQNKHEDAIKHFKLAIKYKPNFIDAYNRLDIEFNRLNRPEEASIYLKKAIKIDPENSRTLTTLALTTRIMCEWSHFDDFSTEISMLANTTDSIEPFYLFPWCDDPRVQFQCAKNHTQSAILPGISPINAVPDSIDKRIRIGYISRDFRNHVVAQMTIELFELHNREKFEVFGFALGEHDNSEMRKHLVNAFDHFIEVGHLSDEEVAILIAENNIHILVDLNGYSMGAHPRILAMRPAPVQVNYLGYIGTMGADFIDYIIVDDFSVPENLQPYFTETLVHLPCYMANDKRRAVSHETPSRTDAGLPDKGFVFCCFNTSYKITPKIFDIWMNCLVQVPESVLWLMRENAAVEKNLRNEAQARGIDPQRLVFAPRTSAANHLARQRLADLFLDTLPVNAGATACDALWVGLPLLTCPGNTFISRMAGGLLHAAGLPELVVNSLEAYEALAIQLAMEPGRLQSLKNRLVANRDTCLLFNSDKFRDNIETAFINMWNHWCDEHNRPSHQSNLLNKENGDRATLTPKAGAPINELLANAVTLHQQGKLDAAEQAYREILVINPKEADALHLFGIINAQRGDLDTAINYYHRSIEVNPKLLGAYNNLGIALYSMNKHQEAIRYLQQAIAISPNVDAYYNLGNCLYGLQQYEKALSSYQQALLMDPNHANAQRNMKATLKRLGR